MNQLWLTCDIWIRVAVYYKLPKTPIAGVQKVRQVHHISRFVHLGRKLSNQSIFRQVYFTFTFFGQGLRAFYVRT